MKSSSYLAVAGIVVLLCTVPCQLPANVELSLKADTSKKCAICHYQWVPTFFLEHRSTPIAHFDEKTLEVFSWKVCISCHDGSVRDSRGTICNDLGHQVGRIPSQEVSIPPDFPLDENGALKCTTCHTPHAVSEASESMVEYFLRAPNENSSFCRTCHKQKLGGLARGNHPLDVSAQIKTSVIVAAGGQFGTSQDNQIICETCHRAHGGINEKFLVLPVENIQSMSVLCEACHTKNAIRPGRESGKTLSHPVDVVPGQGVQIPPAWKHGEKIVVGTRGEIVCRTCHKPHGADSEFLLATPQGKDALCIQCHHGRPRADSLHDTWGRAPSEQASTGRPSPESFACASCHRVHNSKALFLNTLSSPSDLEPFFHIPHFGLHPPAFLSTAFQNKDAGETDGIVLFAKTKDASDGGTIVCGTCHDVHQMGLGTREDEVATDNRSKGFLRQVVAETFCKTCHAEEALVRFLYFHTRW
jgi:predicted CXXCH cytochrome family protein